jgi:hypothetical protein
MNAERSYKSPTRKFGILFSRLDFQSIVFNICFLTGAIFGGLTVFYQACSVSNVQWVGWVIGFSFAKAQNRFL